MSRAGLSSLAMGIAAVVAGVGIGYYAGFTGALPLSGGMLAIVAMTLAGLGAAFYVGRATGRVEPATTSLQRSWDAFRRELDRARRFGRTFVLMRIPSPDSVGAEGISGLGALAALPILVRSTDTVWAMDGNIYVVLPEATRESARQLMARLRVAIPGEPALDRVEAVEFPADGVTTRALVSNLRPLDEIDAAGPVRLKLADADVNDEAADERAKTG